MNKEKNYSYEEVYKSTLEYFKGDELATNVWISKYAAPGELNPNDMHRRMAKEFAKIEFNYSKSDFLILGDRNFNVNSLSDYGKTRVDTLTEESIFDLLKDFKYLIPQGSVMATLGTNQIASLSNCWVVESPLDSYAGIHKTDGDLIFYYKRRGGCGVDISNLRPENSLTNNTAKSSTGAVSFMNRFSNTTREVAMNGRRGALMISIDINHPDVLEFIKIKRDLTKVTGANISIRINDDFMKAVENNEDYILRFPCNSNINGLTELEDFEYNKLDKFYIPSTDNFIYVKRIKAKEYWDELIKSAKDYAEPGLMYWNNVNNYDPCSVYEEYKPKTSNPCGEQFLPANDSCRLLVLNFSSFVNHPFTVKAEFDFDKFYEITYESLRLGDNLVDLEAEYIDRIINKIKTDPEPSYIKQQELELWIKSKEQCLAARRIGLGITALGDTLAMLGLKYDSQEAIETIDKIMNTKMRAELDCTIDLSITRGHFKGFNAEKEFEWATKFPGDINLRTGMNEFYQMLLNEFPKQSENIIRYGRRNISWSTISPAGSLSILANNCTSGCEPLFQPFYMRRKKINSNDLGNRVDFIDDNGDKWQEFPILHSGFKQWCESKNSGNTKEFLETLDKNTLQVLFENSPYYQSTANDLDWKKRVEIQALLQKYTTNAISSTINLPSTVTYEQVSDIYLYGWHQNLKGQTIYVDGSRSGVLVSEPKKEDSKFVYNSAVKRPKSLDADVYQIKAKGSTYTICVGLLNNLPYEVFAFLRSDIKNQKGKITKKSKGRYELVLDAITVDNIIEEMLPEEEIITRLISTSLRHGTNIQFLVEQLNKTSGSLVNFDKAIARVLKTYIPDNTKSTVICADCSSTNVIFEEGCSKCKDCGSSKCG